MPRDHPWSELVDELAEFLIEDAIECAADKRIALDRAQLSEAARARAAELIYTELVPITRKDRPAVDLVCD